MTNNVLWRKQSCIIMLLAEELRVESERAMDIYYASDTARQLADPAYGLQQMSDKYIAELIIEEIRNKQH